MRLLNRPLLLLLVAGVLLPAKASAIDWNGVEGLTINLFYPGQRSWEFVLSRREHSGAPRFRGGKNCNECHEEDEPKLVDNILKNIDAVETYGDPGQKPHVIPLNVKVAVADQQLHFRLEWTSTGYVPAEDKLDGDFETKVTVMLAGDIVRLARRAGCWMLCHDDARSMPSASAAKDVTKYMPVSRTLMTRRGGGENYKPEARLDRIMEAGLFVEYWQARLNPGQPPVPGSGHILERRYQHENTNVEVKSQRVAGRNVVEIRRPLETDLPGQKTIDPRRLYMLGFAIHESHASGRHHYVSLEKMLAFDDYEDAHLIAAQR